MFVLLEACYFNYFLSFDYFFGHQIMMECFWHINFHMLKYMIMEIHIFLVWRAWIEKFMENSNYWFRPINWETSFDPLVHTPNLIQYTCCDVASKQIWSYPLGPIPITKIRHPQHLRPHSCTQSSARVQASILRWKELQADRSWYLKIELCPEPSTANHFAFSQAGQRRHGKFWFLQRIWNRKRSARPKLVVKRGS